ncbi:MAG: Mov34/MPN/PAD-1 family protein [Desulfofundulus sp.]
MLVMALTARGALELLKEGVKPPSFFRVHAREGIYEVRCNEIGLFSTLLESWENDAEPEWWEGVKLFLPKINVSLLMKIISFFRTVNRHFGGVEALAYIFWSTSEKQYYVYCPVQTVSGISIDVVYDQELYMKLEEDVLVMEIHSHHNMNAFFSAVDDEYEKATRFYGVVGKIDKFFPDIKVRYANARTHREIPPEAVFQMPHFPASWLENVIRRERAFRILLEEVIPE